MRFGILRFMHPNDRQKMCTHCDGRIPLEADACPYCAADAKVAGLNSSKELHHQSLQKSLTSLYSPPYEKKGTFFNKTEPIKEPMLEKKFNPAASLGAPALTAESSEDSNEEKNGFWPILLLSTGANLLALGLLQLFFSDNGLLRLEWNSAHWY